jgi:predicted N-acetyltransferase YhbS
MTMTAGALELRALEPGGEDEAIFPALSRLLADAYPVMRVTTAEALAKHTDALKEVAAHPGTAIVVAERDGALVGVMRLYDYQMNVRGLDALAGGVGAVAVSRAHKRQGIARAMIAWYLDAYRRRGAPFAVLHPFRLDFYRALGFGYGTPVRRYRVAPATLRDDGARGTIKFLGESDLDALLACYERVRRNTNGLIAKHRAPAARALGDAAIRHVAVEEDGEVRGFMQTSVLVAGVSAGGDELRNRDELIVRELTYEDERHLAALLVHLRAQQDQFARIVFETQDEAFYLAATDPRDGSDLAVAPPASHRVAETGLGVMYRILDVEAALAHLPAAAAPLTLRLDIEDGFFPQTGGTRTFRFGPHGAPRPDDAGTPPDATLSIGIADLSSVVMGSLRLRDVVRHRLATLEPRAKLGLVDAAFRADQPPICTTRF